jgi:hypothetical protein
MLGSICPCAHLAERQYVGALVDSARALTQLIVIVGWTRGMVPVRITRRRSYQSEGSPQERGAHRG